MGDQSKADESSASTGTRLNVPASKQNDTEISETQKMRSDLLKWKLVVIAVLGAVGLGFEGNCDKTNPYSGYVLGLIPLASVYVDALCAHLNLRILAKNAYLITTGRGDKTSYPEFCDTLRRWPKESGDADNNSKKPSTLNIFELEDMALSTTTYCVSVAMALFALVRLVSAWQLGCVPCAELLQVLVLLIAAGLGFLGARKVKKEFAIRNMILDEEIVKKR